ncbi:MAG: hypothetical protein IPM49_11760 [Flavobacteriales bacterium]|nr:hypothetical protein [Flavobacteriales bacterium]
MRKRSTFLAVAVLPIMALAQGPGSKPVQEPKPINAPTLAVLLANRPAHIEQTQWLEMMEQPANRSLYPMRITPATLDTLDGRLLDRRFQYILVR